MIEGRDTITGYRTRRGDLLGVHNAKTIKGESLGVLTAIMYLAPASLSGFNVCAASSPDCRADCLYYAGRGAMSKIQRVRIARTQRLYSERALFVRQLQHEIEGLQIVAQRHAMRLAVRLNGTSDVLWERIAPRLFDAPGVTFYDYTKHAPRARNRRPGNYALTFSAEAHTLERAHEWLHDGVNVAAVVTPATHTELLALGDAARVRFHDATQHDARFLDPAHSVALLLPKGSLRKKTPQTSRMLLSKNAALELGRAAWQRHNAEGRGDARAA